MLRELAEGLWVTERPLRFMGLEVGTRMTVVRLRDGGLFLHSPVALDDELREALQRLGEPRFVVAPNRFHHLFIGEYREAFPGVKLYAAPGLPEKRRDLTFDLELSGASPAEWADELDQAQVEGVPMMGEVVFCHRASRTLISCDLAFNLGPSSPFATRLAFRLIGGYGRLEPTLTERVLIRDRAAVRGSLEQILGWSFERVIVSHGDILESDGRDALRRGYDWLLKT